MKRWLPAIVALIVGVGIGWLVGRAFHDAPANAEPAGIFVSDKDKQAPLEAPDSGGSEEAPVSKPPAQATEPAVSTTKPNDAATDAIIASLKGDGELRGMAIHPDGTPASGVALVATSQAYFATKLDSELVRDAFEHHCVTAEDGSFTFTGLQAVNLQIRCESPDLFARDFARPANWLYMRPGDFVRLIIVPTTQIEISVVDGSGEEVVVASVGAKLDDGSNAYFSLAWTPSNRVLRVLPGPMTISAHSMIDSSLSDKRTVVAEAGKPLKVIFTLAPLVGLYLDVIPPELWYGDTTTYYLLTRSDAAEFKLGTAQSRMVNGVAATKLSEHRMVFPKLAAGDYTLIAANNRVEFERIELYFEGGNSKQTLRLTPLDQSQHLLVRVRDPRGAVRFDAEVQAYRPEADRAHSLFAAEALANDGTRWVLLQSEAAAPLTHVALKASIPRVGVVEKIVVLTRGVVIDLYLFDAVTVTIQVRGLTNELLNQLDITLLPEGALKPLTFGGGGVTMGTGTGLRRQPRIAETVLFQNVPLGRADVIIRTDLGSRSSIADLEVTRQTVSISREVVEFTLTLPLLYRLTVNFPEGVKPAALSIAGARYSSAEPVADGMTWPAVPAGDYVITDSRTGEMRVEVRGDLAILWQPTPFNCIVLESLDSNGVLSAAGFKNGDVILTIDGQSNEGFEALAAALSDARKAQSTRLGVDRGGESLVIEVEGAILNEGFRRTGYRYSRR